MLSRYVVVIVCMYGTAHISLKVSSVSLNWRLGAAYISRLLYKIYNENQC